MQTELRNVQLLGGSYHPSIVKELFEKSIDYQINQLKLKNLGDWVRNHTTNQHQCGNEIARLQAQKEELLKVISEAELIGCNLHLSENLEISFEPKLL